jgi:hypothetical protein
MKLTCHCEAVELDVTLSEALSEAVRCDCSFCRRRAAATVDVAEGDFTIIRGADNLSLYQWKTKTAEHYFCKTCGIYTHHRRRSKPKFFGVNIGALEGITLDELRNTGWADGVNHPSDA